MSEHKGTRGPDMLHIPESRGLRHEVESPDEPSAAYEIDFDRLLRAARRQAWVVILGGLLGLAAGVAYVIAAIPLYTASSDILIDKTQSNVVNQLSYSSGVFDDEAEMLSQVELLKSDQIARAVVANLKLDENEAFLAGNPSLIGSAIGGVRNLVSEALDSLVGASDTEQVRLDRTTRAANILQANLDVTRVGRTYVLGILYTAGDRKMAEDIVRAYGNAYLDDQLQAKYEAARRAGGWLQDRIAELRQQSFAADLAVQTFRNENGLISSGNLLVSEQRLNEVTTQLVEAQAATAEAKARLDQIRDIIRSGRTEAVVNDALQSETINRLRARYLDASRRETEIASKVGPDHVQALRLRAEMAEYERLIFEELGRIAESYQNVYNVAQQRQAALEASSTKIVGENANNNTVQVRLRQLERESDTLKGLYDNFLQRFQQTVQQQSFPVNDVRIITPASAPNAPSFPRKPLVLALFLVAGIAAGSGFGAFREYRERFFRTGDQVRSELQAEFLGFAPLVPAQKLKEGGATTEATGDGLWRAGSVANFVRQHPLSSFAETLRNVKVAADMGLPERDCKVIGVISSLPSEGKSVISASLGTLLAMQGANVLLIDGDLRNPGLTRNLDQKPEYGLVEAVLGTVEAEATLRRDRSGRLSVMPTVLRRRVSHTSELIASPSMAKLLADARAHYDYIVVDLPPIAPVVDAKAFANRVDAFLFVVEWGRTSRQLVRGLLNANPVFREKSLGIVLNKSDEAKLKLYREFGSSEYYSSRYSSYYQS